MQAIEITKPNEARVVSVDNPEPSDQDVLIQVHASGICGTDIHILKGEYMGEYPIIPGHEISGTVVKMGSGVTRFKEGDRVAIEPNIACGNCEYCLNNHQNFCSNWQAVGVTRAGGMAEYVVAPETAVFPIGDLSFEEGAFVEPLSCVIHGVERAQISLADRVLVVGAGPIGGLLIQLLIAHGVGEVVVAETNPSRATIAKDLGATRTLSSLTDADKDTFDLVVDATGVPKVMERLLDYAKYGGKVLLFGVPPMGDSVSFDAFQIFRKGLTILSSFTSVRNSFQAIELLKTKRVNVNPLISHLLPLADFQKGVDALAGRGNVMKVLLTPNR